MTKRGPLNCTIPPLAVVSVTKSPMTGWTKTQKVSKSQAAIWDTPLRLLKGKRLCFSDSPVWKFYKCSETSDSVWRRSPLALDILVVKAMRGKFNCRLFWGVWGSKIWHIITLSNLFFKDTWAVFFCSNLFFSLLETHLLPYNPDKAHPYWIHIDSNCIVANEKQGKWSRPAFRLGPGGHLYASKG